MNIQTEQQWNEKVDMFFYNSFSYMGIYCRTNMGNVEYNSDNNINHSSEVVSKALKSLYMQGNSALYNQTESDREIGLVRGRFFHRGEPLKSLYMIDYVVWLVSFSGQGSVMDT